MEDERHRDGFGPANQTPTSYLGACAGRRLTGFGPTVLAKSALLEWSAAATVASYGQEGFAGECVLRIFLLRMICNSNNVPLHAGWRP
jgi:hypothetical protein